MGGRPAVVFSAIAVACLAWSCTGARPHLTDQSLPTTTTTTAPTTTSSASAEPDITWVAQAQVREVPVFDAPDAVEPVQTVTNPNENGVPVVFVVDDQAATDSWVHVHLPTAPNGSAGWIRKADVQLVSNPYRVVVDLAAHRLTVSKSGESQLQAPVEVGHDDAPAPGVYFIQELIKLPDPEGFYGPYAYGLSGFPVSVAAIHAGTGVIGIHGTNDPTSLGKDVNGGSIAVANDVIEQLAGLLPLGTPVEIVK